MINKLKSKFLSVLALSVIFSLSFLLTRVGTVISLNTYAAYQTISPEKLNKYAQSMYPLLNENNSRYCSSSHIKYKKKVFTVTNRHCCENYTYFFPYVNVGGSLESILHLSEEHDVCVLTASKVKKPLKLAKNEVRMWESILVMGYPMGHSLTPQAGTIILLNHDKVWGPKIYPSHEAIVKILLGNSGSPVLNKYGNVVGLAYATYPYEMVRGIIVPLRYVENALDQAYNLK